MTNNAGILIEDEFNEKSCTSYVAQARDIVAQGARRVRFDIASWGGDIAATRSMRDALVNERICYDTRAVFTSSAASYFLLTGKRREILEGGTIRFHGVGFLVMPPDVDNEGVIDRERFRSWRELIQWSREILMTRTKLDREIVERILGSRDNVIFNAKQALDAGFVDEIVAISQRVCAPELPKAEPETDGAGQCSPQ